MYYHFRLCVASIVFFVSAALCANVYSEVEEDIEKIYKVEKGGTLLLNTSKGSVNISSWNKKEVKVYVLQRARDKSELEKFTVNLSQEKNEISITGKNNRRSKVKVSYRITLPLEFNVRVKTGGGSVQVGDQQGDVNVDTSGGSITIGNVTGVLKADTSGGSIKVKQGGKKVYADTSGGSIKIGPSAGDVYADTSGGSIRIGYAKGNIKADTSGGSIFLEGSDKSVVADTSGGSISIGDVKGTIKADTSGGGIKINGARGAVLADTSGGNIFVELVEARKNVDTSMTLDTSAGSVTVLLPKDLKATISAEASHHGGGTRIHSDFALDIKNDGGDTIAEGDINGGGDPIKISTSHGDINIRKR